VGYEIALWEPIAEPVHEMMFFVFLIGPTTGADHKAIRLPSPKAHGGSKHAMILFVPMNHILWHLTNPNIHLTFKKDIKGSTFPTHTLDRGAPQGLRPYQMDLLVKLSNCSLRVALVSISRRGRAHGPVNNLRGVTLPLEPQ